MISQTSVLRPRKNEPVDRNVPCSTRVLTLIVELRTAISTVPGDRVRSKETELVRHEDPVIFGSVDCLERKTDKKLDRVRWEALLVSGEMRQNRWEQLRFEQSFLWSRGYSEFPNVYAKVTGFRRFTGFRHRLYFQIIWKCHNVADFITVYDKVVFWSFASPTFDHVIASLNALYTL